MSLLSIVISILLAILALGLIVFYFASGIHADCHACAKKRKRMWKDIRKAIHQENQRNAK
ncbi:MAG: hypothetical protein HUJ60_03440 [Bacilli bacterium]|nr:hypothetical protein [Bacilli bacterium]